LFDNTFKNIVGYFKCLNIKGGNQMKIKSKIKSKKEVRKNTAFMLEPSLIDELDYYARKIGITRSLLIRNCVCASLDDLKAFDKTGVLSACSGGVNLMKFFRHQENAKELG
jgi:hypothetical protein